MGQDRAVFPHNACEQTSQMAEGDGLEAPTCDQKQYVAAVVVLFQGCFNLGRHVPVDGERAVEVESHNATVHDASKG